MDTIKKWNKWANHHSYWYVDLMRVAVGLFIILKGAMFMQDPQNYDYYNQPLEQFGTGMFLIHIVVGFNIVGGVMIMMGLLTRWAIFAQLPVLLGAILINFLGRYELCNLVCSSILFILCLFFLFFGSGKHSADYYFKLQA